jgi:LPXTG-site transpeptidase (sortase) family protein
VSATIQPVTQDPDGSMSAPGDPDQVAWYTLGPGMGVSGNVVFAAHVNWGNRPRVFARLDALDKGDAILIVDANGDGYEYVVESSHWVRAEGAPVEEIFAQTTDAKVTLITCGGEYRAATREYLDRLIVKARGA